MSPLGDVLLILKDELDGEGDVAYLKAGALGASVGLNAHEAGHRFRYIRECDDIPVAVERWSSTASSTTYRVTVPDWSAFVAYIDSIRGQPEPTLEVTA